MQITDVAENDVAAAQQERLERGVACARARRQLECNALRCRDVLVPPTCTQHTTPVYATSSGERDEIRVSEALGVVDHGDHHRRAGARSSPRSALPATRRTVRERARIRR